jgi:hypothetical protein
MANMQGKEILKKTEGMEGTDNKDTTVKNQGG